MSVAERIGRLVVAAHRYGFVGGQHAHPLLFERILVLAPHRVVDDALEHLYDKEEKHVGPVEQLAVFAVGLAVAHEDPETLHDATLNDQRGRVPVVVVPDVLRDALNEL